MKTNSKLLSDAEVGIIFRLAKYYADYLNDECYEIK